MSSQARRREPTEVLIVAMSINGAAEFIRCHASLQLTAHAADERLKLDYSAE